MNKKSAFFTVLIIGSALLAGCAPIISGAMNATLTEKDILDKTASHFGIPATKLSISDIKNDVLATSYKTRYAGKTYNCSIYYGAVKCDLLGSTDDFPAPKAAIAPSDGVKAEKKADSKEMSFLEAQTRLNKLGYDVGKPDGQFGKRSVAQLKIFQKSRGLQVTGVLDASTIDELR